MSMAMQPEMKRYTYRLFAVMTVYVITLIGVIRWFNDAPPGGAFAYVVAALPALPIIGAFVVIARLIVEMRDEYVRMLLVRQALIATGFALSVCTIWGFLESFGFVPHVAAYYAAVLWFGGLGVGGCANALIERRAAR
jgi:hypothetical protein